MDKVRTLYCNQEKLLQKAAAMNGVELKLSKYVRTPKNAAMVCVYVYICFFCL